MSRFFIERPKFAFVISIVMVLTGILSISALPVAEYPEVAPPQVAVSAVYTGATAQDIVDSVAAPIESQVNGLENLLYYVSNSDNSGSYSLQIFFKYGTDGDIAQVNVQNAVKRAEPVLPTEVKAYGVSIIKRSSDMLSIFAFKADPEKMDLLALGNYVKMNIRDPIARVDGLNDVQIFANREYSMRIWLDTQVMSAMGISAAEVSQAIQGQNIQAAAGSIGQESSNEYMQFKLNVKGRLKTAEEFENIIVRSDGLGSIVKIKDIATVELGAEKYSGYSTANGQEAVVMAIFRNTDANALDTVRRTKAELERLSESFPEGMTWETAFDPTEFIEISMEEIVETLIVAILLVVAVTYLFLQDWRATVIPVIAIPVSLLGTFPFLWMFGFSINTLSMFGLILVIGSLVDDAIIVVENVMTHIEKGMDPHAATVAAVGQITGPVIAMTMVTVAIYVPICFYGGMVGQIYLQFAVTMSISIVLSAVNALTLSPALCGMILKHHRPSRFSIFKPFNLALDSSRNGFALMSKLLVRRALLTLVIFGGVVYGNYHLFETLPTSFLPEEDRGGLFAIVELPPGATLARTERVTEYLSERVQAIEGINRVMVVNGYSMTGGEGENVGMVIFKLEHWDKRKTKELQMQAIKKEIDAVCASVPEGKIMTFVPPAIMGVGDSGGVEAYYCATGEVSALEMDLQTKQFLGILNNMSPVYQEKGIQFPTQYAFTSYNADTPLLELNIDRDKAEMLNVSINSIFNTLQSKLASYYVNDFNIAGYNFKVKIQSEADSRGIMEDINNIYIPNINSDMVPFTAVGDIEYTVGPRRITRFNQMLAADIKANANVGVSSGTYMRMIEDKVQKPDNFQLEWTGMSLQERNNEGKIVFLLLMSVTFAYLFLVAQYESWMIPLPVMLSVMVATLGAMFGIWICRLDLSIYSQLGLLMLIGIASKNAILIVEFAQEERESGMTVDEAAVSAFKLRYRAVLMTAWSFILGVLPLALASGAGAGSRRAIGITTCAGMLLATLLGIVLIPGLYAIIERTREFFQPKLRRKLKAAEEQRRLALANGPADLSTEALTTGEAPAEPVSGGDVTPSETDWPSDIVAPDKPGE